MKPSIKHHPHLCQMYMIFDECVIFEEYHTNCVERKATSISPCGVCRCEVECVGFDHGSMLTMHETNAEHKTLTLEVGRYQNPSQACD